MNVILVASTDPVLHDMLRACRLSVTMLGAPKLGDLVKPGVKPPDLVIVDHRQGGPLAPALATIRRHHPSTGLLLVLPSLDAMLMLEAMRAGVTECLAHPFSVDDLRAAIGRITSMRPGGRAPDIFAVVGAKGGVGATTVAVNIAATLARLGLVETLFIDLHVTYGDAAVFFGVEPRFSVADAFENLHRLDAAVLGGLATVTPHRVHLLASSNRPAAIDPDVTQVRKLIDLAGAQYPFVVLDVPRSSPAVLDALDAAAAIVVVANQELSAVRSAARLSAAFQQRYGRDRVQLVMSRYDGRAEIGQDDVERVVGMPVRHLLPNNYSAALTAQSAGRPLVLHDSKLSSALTALTHSLADLPPDEKRPKPPKPSGLRNLMGMRARTDGAGTT